MKKLLLMILTLLAAFALSACDNTKYENALALIEAGDHVAAYEMLNELGDYKDTKQLLERFRYLPTKIVDNREGEETVRDIYFFGNTSKSVMTYSNGETDFSEYVYDSDGNKLKEEHTYSNGEMIIYEGTYDANGRLLKLVHTYRNGAKSVSEYKYDANGNKIKEEYKGIAVC